MFEEVREEDRPVRLKTDNEEGAEKGELSYKMVNQTHQMDLLPNPLDLFYGCIWKRVNRKCLERGRSFNINLKSD